MISKTQKYRTARSKRQFLLCVMKTSIKFGHMISPRDAPYCDPPDVTTLKTVVYMYLNKLYPPVNTIFKFVSNMKCTNNYCHLYSFI